MPRHAAATIHGTGEHSLSILDQSASQSVSVRNGRLASERASSGRYSKKYTRGAHLAVRVVQARMRVSASALRC